MTELNMNLPERALEALGKERSALAAYKKQNAEQQKRIRQLEAALKPFSLLDTVGEDDNSHVKRYVKVSQVRHAAAILKGKE